MSNVIDVSFVFDAQGIEDQYPGSSDSNEPLRINAGGLVSMVVNARYLRDPKAQASAHLSVGARPRDLLRIRARSLSGRSGYSVLLDGLRFPLRGLAIVKGPVLSVPCAHVPIPNDTDPSTFSVEEQPDPHWDLTVIRRGAERFTASFTVLRFDDGSFTSAGRYVFDSSLSIGGGRPRSNEGSNED